MNFEELIKDFKLSFSEKIEVIEHKTYDGTYSVTPTRETQILPTTKKLMAQDVIVQPIPKEYGQVSYDQDKKMLIIK